MSEESDLEKTEPATPRRLEKAREEGQVARSRELNTFLLLTTGVVGLWAMGGHIYQSLNNIIYNSMWFDPRLSGDTAAMLTLAADLALQGIIAMLPLFGLLAAVAIISSVILGGLVFSAKALEFKGERLAPLKGVKRMFSAQTLVELLKTIAKAACVGIVAAIVIFNYRDQMVALMYTNTNQALVGGMRLIAICCGLIVASLLIVVLIDAPWQVYSHHKKLRMSRQDVKQEHKESEGDPHVKGRIRQQQRAMARGRMMSAVPAADVVVTNPRHYAVALNYTEGQSGAPRVVAKGTGLIAAKIKSLAQEHKVPMLEAPPLARALYAHVELEHEIPAELYSALAEVLAWVYQLRSYTQHGGTQPLAPKYLDVPAVMDPANANLTQTDTTNPVST